MPRNAKHCLLATVMHGKTEVLMQSPESASSVSLKAVTGLLPVSETYVLHISRIAASSRSPISLGIPILLREVGAS